MKDDDVPRTTERKTATSEAPISKHAVLIKSAVIISRFVASILVTIATQ